MKKVKIAQSLVVLCAMWAAVWLSDGNDATSKECAAGAIIITLTFVMLVIQHVIEDLCKKE